MTKIFVCPQIAQVRTIGSNRSGWCRYSDLDAFPEFGKHIPTRRNVVFTKLASFQHFSRAQRTTGGTMRKTSFSTCSKYVICFNVSWSVGCPSSCACSARTAPMLDCWIEPATSTERLVLVRFSSTSIPSTLSLMSARLSAFPASSFACNKIPKTSCSSEVVVGAGRSLHQSGLEAAPAHELHEQTCCQESEQESTNRSRFHTPFPTVHPQQCNPHK